MAKKTVKQPLPVAPPKAPETTGARLDLPPWPPGLPVDAARFWSASGDLAALGNLPKLDDTPALKRLGPLPFPRGGFPLMGFLATVYEHVVAHIQRVGPHSMQSPPEALEEERHGNENERDQSGDRL